MQTLQSVTAALETLRRASEQGLQAARASSIEKRTAEQHALVSEASLAMALLAGNEHGHARLLPAMLHSDDQDVYKRLVDWALARALLDGSEDAAAPLITTILAELARIEARINKIEEQLAHGM